MKPEPVLPTSANYTQQADTEVHDFTLLNLVISAQSRGHIAGYFMEEILLQACLGIFTQIAEWQPAVMFVRLFNLATSTA